MDNNEILERVTNGLRAASRLGRLYEASVREGPSERSVQGKAGLLSEVMNILGEYAPEPRRSALMKAAARMEAFDNAGRSLRQHMAGTRSGKPDMMSVARTMEAMKPMLPLRHHASVDKLIKLVEVIYS